MDSSWDGIASLMPAFFTKVLQPPRQLPTRELQVSCFTIHPGRQNMKRLLGIILATIAISGCYSLEPRSYGSLIRLVEENEKITATGYAVIAIQNSEDAAQQRLLAIRASKLDAYRALAEQVFGQRIDSQTTIGELVVSNDAFRSRVEGVIYGAELESIEPLNGDTYAVTLSLRRQVVKDLRLLYLRSLSREPA